MIALRIRRAFEPCLHKPNLLSVYRLDVRWFRTVRLNPVLVVMVDSRCEPSATTPECAGPLTADELERTQNCVVAFGGMRAVRRRRKPWVLCIHSRFQHPSAPNREPPTISIDKRQSICREAIVSKFVHHGHVWPFGNRKVLPSGKCLRTLSEPALAHKSSPNLPVCISRMCSRVSAVGIRSLDTPWSAALPVDFRKLVARFRPGNRVFHLP